MSVRRHQATNVRFQIRKAWVKGGADLCASRCGPSVKHILSLFLPFQGLVAGMASPCEGRLDVLGVSDGRGIR